MAHGTSRAADAGQVGKFLRDCRIVRRCVNGTPVRGDRSLSRSQSPLKAGNSRIRHADNCSLLWRPADVDHLERTLAGAFAVKQRGNGLWHCGILLHLVGRSAHTEANRLFTGLRGLALSYGSSADRIFVIPGRVDFAPLVRCTIIVCDWCGSHPSTICRNPQRLGCRHLHSHEPSK